MNRVSAPITRSGLQQDVIKLFREMLRCARTKNDPQLTKFVAKEFKARAHSIGKKEFDGIEHGLRYGRKQMKMMAMPGFKAASYS